MKEKVIVGIPYVKINLINILKQISKNKYAKISRDSRSSSERKYLTNVSRV